MSYAVRQSASRYVIPLLLILSASHGICAVDAGQRALDVEIAANGQYTIAAAGSEIYALRAGVAAEIDGHWLHAADYPRHEIVRRAGHGELGEATEWQVTYSGLQGQPDLVYRLRAYTSGPYGDIQVTIRNTTVKVIHVEAIRSLEAIGDSIVNLGGALQDDRVLSDSFSEDRPAMKIRDLADAENQMHRAVGSQLIFNRYSGNSLFLGALTSDRFLTVLRLHLDKPSGGAPRLTAYEVDSTGTTELEIENSLEHSPPQDRVTLNLPVAPGEELASERLLFSVGRDYHRQLETYGALIQQIHHARTSGPPLMGWWSWTAYYFGLNQGAALTNAQWEAEHLKPLGYDLFHIDEGYQYARGEYSTPDAALFPAGMASLYSQVRELGLVPGIWTAPFEVADRSWVYREHPEWLVKNAEAQPIHAGKVEDDLDSLFILDTTNPGAQQYLRRTYSILANVWGIRYIKLDFMDDSAIEGRYYRPNTTALEAQRIGLNIIRDAVGSDVYLDKDGSPMLNPVGLVDYGRISQDTGHTFDAAKDAAPGIAARYYMNRHFFVADPDAFTVSTQTIPDQAWHESKRPATLDEAKVSIALAAVTGGMLEIGDDLPTLWKSGDRLGLIENPDLIDMVRLGQASVPVDLMTYTAEDGQPSIFMLKEDDRQTVLTVFNWSEHNRSHKVALADLGLSSQGRYVISDLFDKKALMNPQGGVLFLSQPPHSVRMLKIVDARLPALAPSIAVEHPASGTAGETLHFAAQSKSGEAVLSYTWDFGDGVSLQGTAASHAYTRAGDYTLRVLAAGLGGVNAKASFLVHITGTMPTTFVPANKRRYQ